MQRSIMRRDRFTIVPIIMAHNAAECHASWYQDYNSHTILLSTMHHDSNHHGTNHHDTIYLSAMCHDKFTIVPIIMTLSSARCYAPWYNPLWYQSHLSAEYHARRYDSWYQSPWHHSSEYHHASWYISPDTTHHNTMQMSTMHHDTTRCGTNNLGTIQLSTMHHDTIHHGTNLRDIMQMTIALMRRHVRSTHLAKPMHLINTLVRQFVLIKTDNFYFRLLLTRPLVLTIDTSINFLLHLRNRAIGWITRNFIQFSDLDFSSITPLVLLFVFV